MITGVERVNTGLDAVFNNHIIQQLYQSNGWQIGYDEHSIYEKDSPYYTDNKLEDIFSDSGMLLQSYNYEQPDHLNHQNFKLNVLGNLIFEIIIKKQTKYTFKNKKPLRFLWNYYNRSSCGVAHIDYTKENTGSITYYLNSCDAFTFIGNEQVNCVAGTAAIFKSDSLHRGTGPVDSKNKFVLNIVFLYE